jgi:hypothetical protein
MIERQVKGTPNYSKHTSYRKPEEDEKREAAR